MLIPPIVLLKLCTNFTWVKLIRNISLLPKKFFIFQTCVQAILRSWKVPTTTKCVHCQVILFSGPYNPETIFPHFSVKKIVTSCTQSNEKLFLFFWFWQFLRSGARLAFLRGGAACFSQSSYKSIRWVGAGFISDQKKLPPPTVCFWLRLPQWFFLQARASILATHLPTNSPTYLPYRTSSRSNSRDLRHLIRVMKRHDLTSLT